MNLLPAEFEDIKVLKYNTSESEWAWNTSNKVFTRSFTVPAGYEIIGLMGVCTNGTVSVGIDNRTSQSKLSVGGILVKSLTICDNTFNYDVFVYLRLT